MSRPGRTGGILAIVGGRAGWLLLQILASMVYIRVLGPEGYGVAVTVGLYRTFAKLLDLEIPGGALPRLAVAFREDEARGWSLFRTTLGMEAIVAAVGAGLLLLGSAMPWLSTATRASAALPAMFAVAAFQHATDTLSSTLSLPFFAREQFRRLAFFDSVLPAGATALTVGLVLALRSPLALVIGTAAESATGLGFKLWLFRRNEPRGSLRPQIRADRAREILGLGWKIYLTNLSGLIGSRADKVIVEAILGPAALGIYNFATRVPQQALEILARMSDAIMPGMAAAAAKSREAFGPLLRRDALVVATVASSGIVALGALGTPLVQTWMRTRTPLPETGLVVLFMAGYCGLELHFSTLTRAFTATGRILWMLPFTAFNTTVTLLATAPLARQFGIAGVAAMNLAIDLFQFVPITWVTVRTLAPGVAFGPFLARSAAILGVGAAVAASGWILTGWTAPGWPSAVLSLAVLVPGAATLAILLATRLGEMPASLWRRAPLPLRRFEPKVPDPVPAEPGFVEGLGAG